MPPEVHDPIQDGIRRNITGPGATTATRRPPRSCSPTTRPTPSRSPARRAPRRAASSYPWNDSSAFAAYSLDPTHPYTVVSYLEKSGFGSTGAAPVVKCMFLALSGKRCRSTRSGVRAARHHARPWRRRTCPNVDIGCMAPQRQHDHARRGPAAGLTPDGPLDAAAQAGLRARQHPLEPGRPEPEHRLGADGGPARAHRRRLLHRVLGDAHPHRRPVHVRHPPGDLRHRRRGRDGRRDGRRLRVVEGARPHAVRADHRRAVRARRVQPRRSATPLLAIDVGPIQIQPAEFAKFVVLLAMCAYLSDERSPRGRQLPPVPRGADHRRHPVGARHRPARPRLRLGAHRHDDGRAARGRRQGPLHRDDQPAVDRHRRRGVRRPPRQPVPAGPRPRVLRRDNPDLQEEVYQVDERRARPSAPAGSSARAGCRAR